MTMNRNDSGGGLVPAGRNLPVVSDSTEMRDRVPARSPRRQ